MTNREKLGWCGGALLVLAIMILGLPSVPRISSSASSHSMAVPFELLGKTQRSGDAAPVYPADLLAVDGRRVMLSGFATPYDDPQSLTKLLLTPGGGGCYFCAPPKANGVVLVRRASKEPLSLWGKGAVTFEGTLHLAHADSTDEESRQFLFTLDNACMVKNVW